MAYLSEYKIIIPGVGGIADARSLIAVSFVRKNSGRPLASIYAQSTVNSIETSHSVIEDLEGLKKCLVAAGDKIMHRVDESGQVLLDVRDDVIQRGDLAFWSPGVGTKLTIGD